MKSQYIFRASIIVASLLCVAMLLGAWCGSMSSVEAGASKSVAPLENFIQVPMARQNADYTCGVTAFQSILGYYGIDKRSDELAVNLKPESENGTNYLNMVAYAKSLGFAVKIQNKMTIEELKACIKQKKPVLLVIQAWADVGSVYAAHKNEDGHYVVAIGYDDKNFYFMDPSTLGHYTYIPTAEFVLRWHDYDAYSNEVLTQFGMIITKASATPYNPQEIMRLD